MKIRLAIRDDLAAICQIYEEIFDREEAGIGRVGWLRGQYPTLQTAQRALENQSLFVGLEGERLVAAAILDHRQDPAYAAVGWRTAASEAQILVLHTLVVSPGAAGRGYGGQMVRFYEDLAREQGCLALRMDTNRNNAPARSLYAACGYQERGEVVIHYPDGTPAALVCLEKSLSDGDR